MSYLCVRCGRERKEHDTNLVLETEEILTEIEASDVQSGYKMSLLDCCDTPRPSDYVALMQLESYFFGYGSGYVSPDSAEESRLYRESQPMFQGHSIMMMLSNGRMIDIGL